MARSVPPVFKYTKRAFADGMIRRGVFRIGTLYEFRKEEAHGPEIGDPGEGTKAVYDEVDNGTWQDASPIARRFIAAPPDADIRFVDVGFQINHEVPDCYVYCVTRDASKIAMADFGADACVRIENPLQFFKALTTNLRQRQLATASLLSACVYGPRRRHWKEDANVHPALLKPLRYQYQKEIRALWEPRDRPIEPVIIECLPASRFLSLVAL